MENKPLIKVEWKKIGEMSWTIIDMFFRSLLILLLAFMISVLGAFVYGLAEIPERLYGLGFWPTFSVRVIGLMLYGWVSIPPLISFASKVFR